MLLVYDYVDLPVTVSATVCQDVMHRLGVEELLQPDHLLSSGLTVLFDAGDST